MFDDQHRQAMLAVQALQRLQDSPRALQVQVRGRFVQDEDAGAHGQDRGNGHPLLLACGEGVHGPLAQVLNARRRQPETAALGHLSRRQPQVARAKGHLLLHREAEELRGRVLEDQPHVGRQLGDGMLARQQSVHTH